MKGSAKPLFLNMYHEGDNAATAATFALVKRHLRHFCQEGDLHFLALRGQALKQGPAGPLGVEDGGLVTLKENQIFVPWHGEQKHILPFRAQHRRRSQRAWDGARKPGRPRRCCPVRKSQARKAWPSWERSEGTPAGRTKDSLEGKKTFRPHNRLFLDARVRSHSGDGCGATESSQLHQLVHAEAVLAEELLINVLGFLLPDDRQKKKEKNFIYPAVGNSFFRLRVYLGHLSNSNMICFHLYPRYLIVLAMVDADLLRKQSFLLRLAAADSGHVPVWARASPTLDVTRTPIPNRVLTLNIQMDPDCWHKAEVIKAKTLRGLSRRVKVRQVAAKELLLY